MDQKVFDLNDEWQVVLTLNQTYLRAYVNLRHKGKVSPPNSTKIMVQPKNGGRADYISWNEGHDPCEVAIIANTNYEESNGN